MKVHIDFEGQHKYFCDPIKILATTKVSSIKKCLEEIESFIAQGFYAVGYLAYESAMGFNQANQTQSNPPQDTDLPLLLFGIYDKYSSHPPKSIPHYQAEPLVLSCDTTIEEYNQKIDFIRSQIELGNTYQTNYTIQFKAPFDGNPIDYYYFLQKNNQADYCAYLEHDDYHILSISPELFFRIENKTITTKPMKGTVGRGLTTQQDNQQRLLLMSEKNLAENMMIVDLLRNDLSQISKPGTVVVPTLFSAEKYPTVWQLTSTIEGQLIEDIHLFDIFRALFPCGSITGAPKVSTMQIIAQIENTARGVYCGTIGYIEPFGHKMVFNVPIRTLTINQQYMHYGVGGGITWDSTSQDEYNEILIKSAILNRTITIPEYIIESLLLENGQFFLLDQHLTRLTDSASYFNFECNIRIIKLALMNLANTYSKNLYKIRILLRENGQFEINHDSIITPLQIAEIEFAPNCVNNQNLFLYHKTSIRHHFPALTPAKEYINFNQHDEITEFVNGNIALLVDNQWVTPKITSGLLAGTMRQFYLESKQLVEKTLTKKDVLHAEKIAFINSVRKWVEIDDKVFNHFKQLLKNAMI